MCKEKTLVFVDVSRHYSNIMVEMLRFKGLMVKERALKEEARD